MIEVIDFYADWCGPCQAMKPIFSELEKVYEGRIKFSKVNIEEESDKASSYGVMSIPTFVALKDGQESDRKIGAMTRETLKGWLDSLIA